jgi:hypothetical protein
MIPSVPFQRIPDTTPHRPAHLSDIDPETAIGTLIDTDPTSSFQLQLVPPAGKKRCRLSVNCESQKTKLNIRGLETTYT